MVCSRALFELIVLFCFWKWLVSSFFSVIPQNTVNTLAVVVASPKRKKSTNLSTSLFLSFVLISNRAQDVPLPVFFSLYECVCVCVHVFFFVFLFLRLRWSFFFFFNYSFLFLDEDLHSIRNISALLRTGEDAVEALKRNTKVCGTHWNVTASNSSPCSSVQLGLIFFFF